MGLKDKFKRESVSKQQWLDWLSDEPPAAAAQAELRQKRMEQARQAQYQGPRVPQPPQPPVAQQPSQTLASPKASPSSAVPPAAGVSIQINIPQLRKPHFKRLRLLYGQARTWLMQRSKKQLIIGITVLAILLLSWVGTLLTRHTLHHKMVAEGSTASTNGGAATGDVAGQKPDFTPVVPGSKDQLATPDNVHSRYDATKHSYTYLDTIDSKQVTVSQQRLASSTVASQDAAQAVKNLQNGNVVTHQLKTGWGQVNVLINQKYNSLMVVFTVDDKLLFIQSSNIIADNSLTTYINALD